jgi:hypothetical protein
MTQREYSHQLWCGSVVRCLKEVKIYIKIIYMLNFCMNALHDALS